MTESTSSDPLEVLSRRKGMNWRTFVVPEARLFFTQLNKNACTSLKWMIAGIAGEDFEAFGPGIEASTNRFDDIHDRRQWTKVPKLSDLDPQLRAQIHPDNGWFIFAVTRDPRTRVFSAWESKLLLDNPGYRSSRSKFWYPQHPASPETVLEDFTRFVGHFEQAPDSGIRLDGHFRDQVEMLHEDLVPYSEIYDLQEMDRLKSDLQAHLDRVGWQGELYLPRVNDTPLRANADVFADGLRERVEKVYSADFDRFGDRWDYGTIESMPAWTAEQILVVNQLAEQGHRVGLLLDEAAALRSQVAEQSEVARKEKARADELAARTDELAARADDLAARLRAALRPRPLRTQLRADLRRVLAAVRRRLRAR